MMPTTEKLMSAVNICELLDDETVKKIGAECAQDLTTDLNSRQEWQTRMAQANKLALQVPEKKTWPWPGAANVKFPLITVAALQFAAKAYPALVPGSQLVKTKVYGPDQGGERRKSAERIEGHMTWQNLEQDARFEEEMDKLLLVEAISGCVFKKRIFDPAKGRQSSRMVLPENFVVNYWTRDLESASRYTETFHFTKNEIQTRILDGRFANRLQDVETTNAAYPDQSAQQQSPIVVAQNTRQGIQPQGQDNSTPYFTAEQYCWLDLDDDGYQEPYIVTFDVTTAAVWRIVARYNPSGIQYIGEGRNRKILQITPVEVYTKYSFIPSPDGGFYDLGLGALLGPINESVNTAFNQSFDAGTMYTLGGGFLGRGFKGKAGAMTFQPNEWKPVDAVGDDLRKNILPLPVKGPSVIFLKMVEFLVSYAERIVSATDLQMGENIGQNTPAETARTMDSNGARVYNSIFKRNWRALRNEFRLQASLNSLFLESDKDYKQLLASGMIAISDYRQMGVTVRPAADPHVVSDNERKMQADKVVQMAMTMPGWNRYQSQRRWCKAYEIPDYEEVLPQPMTQGPDGQPIPANDYPPPPPDPKMIDANVKVAGQQLDEKKFVAEIMERQVTLPKEMQEDDARIAKLFADAQLAIAKSGNEELEPLVQAMWAQVESQGRKRDHLINLLQLVMDSKKDGEGNGSMPSVGKVAEMAAQTGIIVPKAIQ